MFFEISLTISLIIFGIGICYKILGWFSRTIGYAVETIPITLRLHAAFRGILETILSHRLVTVIRTLILEVLFQCRTLKEDRYRWIMHLLIFFPFSVLLILHALGNLISIRLFSDYSPTLNPFLFLRDLMGVFMLIGLIMALCRRISLKNRHVRSKPVDYYALGILAMILVSGFLLEGFKITSYSTYERMVEDYAATDDDKELESLEKFWVQEFGVVSPQWKPPFDQEILTLGREVHEDNCAGCHSSPNWGFTGYILAKLVAPMAYGLDRAGMSNIMWYIHILASFFALAYLPFSKMFHIIASPINLVINAAAEPEKSHPANVLSRRILELDACTHCGTCSYRCSTAVAYNTVHNQNILPSERMIAIKVLSKGKTLRVADLRSLQEGITLCTNCDRCTVVCPVGINLRELWFSVREHLLQQGYPEPLILSPYAYFRGLNRQKISSDIYSRPIEKARSALSGEGHDIPKGGGVLEIGERNLSFREELARSSKDLGFSYCFSCENCTTVCPVVENYENPQEVLTLLPHQIMRAVGLGMKELALSSMMLWDCVTCYQCQEHCPQGVQVTDLFYELKNQACKELVKSGNASVQAADEI